MDERDILNLSLLHVRNSDAYALSTHKMECLPNKKLGEMDMEVHASTLVAEGRILEAQS